MLQGEKTFWKFLKKKNYIAFTLLVHATDILGELKNISRKEKNKCKYEKKRNTRVYHDAGTVLELLSVSYIFQRFLSELLYRKQAFLVELLYNAAMCHAKLMRTIPVYCRIFGLYVSWFSTSCTIELFFQIWFNCFSRIWAVCSFWTYLPIGWVPIAPSVQ